MMKWVMLVLTILAFGGAWQASTPGQIGLLILLGTIAAIASFLGFLAARVGAVAQSQASREVALLVTARGRAAAPGAGRASAGAGAAADDAAGFLYAGTSQGEAPAHADDHTDAGGGGDGGDGGGGGD